MIVVTFGALLARQTNRQDCAAEYRPVGVVRHSENGFKHVHCSTRQFERVLGCRRSAAANPVPVPTVGDLEELGVGSPEGVAPSLADSEESQPWAEVVQQQTRAAIAALSVTQGRYLTIKHRVVGNAALFAFDDGLLVDRFRDGRKWKYPDVEALLTDGWAIDQVRRGITTKQKEDECRNS